MLNAAAVDASVDIRTSGNLSSFSERSNYILSISDCSNLLSVEITAANDVKISAISDAVRRADIPLQCEFPFYAEGLNRFTPSATLLYSDQTTEVHQETFFIETTLPSIKFESVSLQMLEGQQYLTTTVTASDDVDVSYLGFNVSGIRASDLRNAGGVVSKALTNAFASTNGVKRVYPSAEAQSSYNLSIPITSTLDADAIAHDGVVLLDLMVVDSSGNQRSYSNIQFTGSDVKESATDLSVSPSSIIFTNLLETAVVIPSVNFQFRGVTPLPGAASGVSYSSSHPDLIAVTSTGIVYPLAETTGQTVTITVDYIGLPSVTVPVEVNLSKNLVSLEAKGLTSGQVFTLDSLNKKIAIPDVVAVFDDNSRTDISRQFSLISTLGEGATGVLELDGKGNLLARAVIPEETPIPLTIQLASQPNVNVIVPLAAKDALPTVEIKAPRFAEVDDSLIVTANVQDDVAVKEVRFFLNGTSLGPRFAPPYEMNISVTEGMSNQALVFSVIAIDSAGQESALTEHTVTVNPKADRDVPTLTWESPAELQRVVVGAPIRLQLTQKIDDIQTWARTKKIKQTDFFMDGALIGTSLFPLLEEREEPGPTGKPEKVYYEVWRLDVDVTKHISVAETSVSVHAEFHGTNGGKSSQPARLVRLIQNQAPKVIITSPPIGTSVSVGQDLAVTIEMQDDTLALGSQLDLFVNDRVIDSFDYSNDDLKYSNALEIQKASHTFRLPIIEELLGSTLRIRSQLTDRHGEISLSEVLKVPVKEDQAPSVALSHPTNGMHIVSGQYVELRADAVDDVKVSKVEFFVDDRLVGSDVNAPFSFNYESPQGITKERIMLVHAIAYDSKDQSTTSQQVQVTLGQDEERPVVNISSPPVTHTEGGEDISEVVEDSEIVVKVSGYDNVGVVKLELRGVRLEGTRYVVTGDLNDILTGVDFAPQQIPGALKAYSSLKLVKVPFFKNATGVLRDRYPIEITAWDKTGNSSTAKVTVGVVADKDPYIVVARQERESYLPLENVQLDVQARDDRAVSEIQVTYYVDNASVPALTQVANDANGLIPAENVQASYQLDIASLNLSNADHVIRADIIATDNRGHKSNDNVAIYSVNIVVKPDNNAPLLGIKSPIQGSTLYHENAVTFEWRAVDESKLQQVRFLANGIQIHSRNLSASGKSIETDFNYTLPATGDELVIQAIVTDVFNNEAVTNWRYEIISDEAPVISIRTPPAGSRYIEGESFTINAQVTDNRKLTNVTIFAEQGGQSLFSKSFGPSQIAEIQSAGRYFAAALRTPHKPDAGEDALIIGVRATDNSNLTTEKLLDLTILDDLEAPNLLMEDPAQAFSIMPGDSFTVKGSGDDNIYIENVVAVLVDELGDETILPWKTFSRNNKVESVTIPNPLSFGTLIAGTRFYTDFKGSILIPLEYLAHAGKTFKFKLRSKDRGYNITDTPSVDLTILSDEEAPVINIKSPPNLVYDRQPLFVELEITDNLTLDNYKVYIAGQETTPLASAQNINEKSVTISENDKISIDLSAYSPIPEEGKQFTLIVTAEDAANNVAEVKRLVTIEPDKAPVVSIINDSPQDTDPVKGGILYKTTVMKDDYVTSVDPVRFFPVYSSLKGLNDAVTRLPTGKARDDSTNEIPKIWPYISLQYPEANNLNLNLIVGGKSYIRTINNVLEIEPLPILSGRIKLDVGIGNTVEYQITSYSDNACTAMVNKVTVTDIDGINVSEYLGRDIVSLEVTPIITDNQGVIVDNYIKSFLVYKKSLSKVKSYTSSTGNQSLSTESDIVVLLKDQTAGINSTAFIASRKVSQAFKPSFTNAQFIPLPVHFEIQKVAVLAHAVDRFSLERSEQPLTVLLERNIQLDQVTPELNIDSPASGATMIPLRRFDIKLTTDDDSEGLRSIQLFENGSKLIREFGGTYREKNYVFPYEVPRAYDSGELQLLMVANDHSGNSITKTLNFPLAVNEVPTLNLKEFASYKVDGKYRKKLTKPERLNYGEFWVRVGEDFRLAVDIDDDAGLKSYVINRLDRLGNKVEEFYQNYLTSCPNPSVLHKYVAATINFNQAEPTEYEIIVEDTYGNTEKRTILVHPLTNMAPGIRITSPANDQYVVAGTFRIKVGIVATDDRLLSKDNIEIYANGVKLESILSSKAINTSQSVGGPGVIQQAFAEIYDEIEQNYTVDMADDYGNRTSPYAMEKAFVLNVPSGLIRFNEPVNISVLIRDSDNAVARHEITMIAAADEINPEVAITRPDVGYGPTEFSDFTLGYRGYDNVKVAQLQLYTSYGVTLPNGDYVRNDFGAPIRTINAIEDRDFEPVTTVNIDTPEYKQLIHVDRLLQVINSFSGQTLTGNELYDVWIRVAARDPSGNERIREIRYPIQIDERPVVDIASPVPGATVVEGIQLPVNVNAFDDVGIAQTRLIATHGPNNIEIYNELLRQPPYQYAVTLPAYDPDTPENNRIHLRVEAIDTYGAAFNDLDQHLAFEEFDIEIIEDQAPTIVIAVPTTESEITEGEYMLVQVNAIDDVGLDRVSLQVNGLLGGDRVFTDTNYPYEFLVQVPYGQAGKDLSLTASTTEVKLSGIGRSVSTPTATIVHVNKDILDPEIIVLQPAISGASVVEKRSIRFVADATDNVRVSIFSVELIADKDGDCVFENTEIVQTRQMLAPPYHGTLQVGILADYFDENAVGECVNKNLMQLRFKARDGAGNEAIVTRPVTLVANTPPQVNQIKVLDSRGFSLGSTVSEITEGRSIILNVIASDPEVGVDSVRFYYALGNSEFKKIGDDAAAPFQFHFKVPAGQVGTVMHFKADATDVDGYLSDESSPLNITITEDKPPTATIIKPDNDESVIIDGQDIEVLVEAIDDLGADGIDRVVFYVNGKSVDTVYDNYSKRTGSVAQEHVYGSVITPPADALGFVIHAVVYDVLGHSTQSAPVRVGKIEDTVAPKLGLLSPFMGEIVTSNESIRAVIAIDDIGIESDRQVTMNWIREYQDDAGLWVSLHEVQRTLYRNDLRQAGDTTPVSDPNNHHYIYWDDFVDGNVLQRGPYRNERVRIVSTVATPNHTVSSETFHEVGLPIGEQRFLSPVSPAFGNEAAAANLANDVYYTSVSQFTSPDRTNAMMAAWSNIDPMRLEQSIGNLLEHEIEQDENDQRLAPRTGLFILDATNEDFTNDGTSLVYSELLIGASEIFAGTITELHTDASFVLASKSGEFPDLGSTQVGGSFTSTLEAAVRQDPESGGTYYDNTNGELLVFNIRNGEAQFGLPYLLSGRIDMPYPDVFGLTRKDDIAFVANGNGGVQVIDISNLSAPYHIGYIKPNGFTRDVAVKDNFLYIAASHEGLVIADIADPAMPIVARLDTLGVANRLHIVGDKVFVTDMAGDGLVSQLNIISIADPYSPQLLRTVELHPARPDLVADGSYDVTVTGNKAFVSVHYSDQEDKPAQSVVEVIDLAKLDDPKEDATIPTMIHRFATDKDFAARGMTLARGAIQVAAGKRGINRIEFQSLNVLSHLPVHDAQNVSTDLASIEIELSGILPATTVLSDYIQVLEGDPSIGLDVTSKFSVDFGLRNNLPAYRFIKLTRNQNAVLDKAMKYYVRIKKGLDPLTGLALSETYEFVFNTSAAGNAIKPDVVSITPNTGSIEGNTQVVIRGTNFGDKPKLYIGGQRLVVEKVDAATTLDPYEKIHARTVPNYAGPASVKVINNAGLANEVIGGFTYVDILKISFIDPPVVRVSQLGQGDRVRIVGYGFNDGITIKAYKSGDPSSVVVNTVDNDRLKLYSAEQMNWVVPDFGGSYRGFVDVEISDDVGRRYLLPDALFYGRLQVDRRLITETHFKEKDITALLGDDPLVYVPDTVKLPPGTMVDLDSDIDLNLIYVLGRGLQGGDAQKGVPGIVATTEEFHHYFAPGWISLVHYNRDVIGEAAPMHGLGYFNLPQDLVPSAMTLSDKQLYVTAKGLHFPLIDTEYEDKVVVLVYDRETRLPGTGTLEQPEGKDRDILYSLPLNFTKTATSIVTKDNLLFVSNTTDGVAVISLADPRKPSVIRILKQGVIKGIAVDLKATDLNIVGNQLHVVSSAGRFIFDIASPTLPQLSYHKAGAYSAALKDNNLLVKSNEKGLEATLYDANIANHMRETGQYRGNGFKIPGITKNNSVAGLTSLFAMGRQEKTKCSTEGFEGAGLQQILDALQNGGQTKSYNGYIGIFDVSRPDQISMVDALKIQVCDKARYQRLLYTDDGLIAVATGQKDREYSNSIVGDSDIRSELYMIDTLLLDLVSTVPANGSKAIPTNFDVKLNFTQSIEIPLLQSENGYLSQYIDLIYDDGSPEGVLLGFTASLNSTDATQIIIQPTTAFAANTNYKVNLKGVLGSRRTAGLFDHTIIFATASDSNPAPVITKVDPPVILTNGGTVFVTLENGSDPSFLFSGDNAPIVNVTVDDDNNNVYELTAPEGLAGPSKLTVVNSNGTRDEQLGAIQYVEPLALKEISPKQGSVNGGTKVTIKGGGFRPGLNRVTVKFDEVTVPTEDIKVLDVDTVEIITPAGRIGKATLTVELDNGQVAIIPDAYDYQQPIQANIEHEGSIRDMKLDPTGTYLITAVADSVRIFDIASSTYTGDEQNPLNLDELRGLIDQNDDDMDDRIVADVKLPGGYAALGIETFFERNSDRIFVTAAVLDAMVMQIQDQLSYLYLILRQVSLMQHQLLQVYR